MTKITELLKHREPFLFVDNITLEDNLIVGERKFLENEPFFTGHFPEYPIVPGVILVEAMAQCGGAGLRKSGSLKSANFVLINIENAKFHKEVLPGETIKMVIKNELISETVINQSGKAYVDNKIVARAEWMCAVKPELTSQN